MLFENDIIKLRSKIKLSIYSLFLTKLICVSYAIKNQIDKALLSSKKTYVHYSGTELNNAPTLIKRAEIKTTPIKIACIAFHDYVKGIDVLLKALSIMQHQKEFSNFELHQIGGGNEAYQSYLKEIAINLKIEDKIIWHGIRNDIPYFLKDMHIYVQPSRSEGMGVSLMEAAQAGLPLIGSNVGGIPEIIHHMHSGLLFPAEDPLALAEAILLLINNAKLQKMFTENATKILKDKFNIHNNVEKLIVELYS